MKKKATNILGLLLILILLASCANDRVDENSPNDSQTGGTSEEQASTSPPKVEPAAKPDPVELVIYYPFPNDWNMEALEATFGEAIKKKFPHITANFIVGEKGKSISELMAAREMIDITFHSIGAIPAQLLDPKLEYDITPLIKQFNYDLSKLEPVSVAMGQQIADGGLYGLPAYVPPSAVYYNIDVFEKFGVEHPRDGMTWDDLYEINKELTRKDGDQQYYGLAARYGHLALMNQQGLNPVNPETMEATITSDAWKGFAQNVIRFYEQPGYERTTLALDPDAQTNRFFTERNTGMFIQMTTIHADRLEGMNFDIASFPVFKEAPEEGPQPYPTFFHVTSISKHKEQAFEVIAYFTSEEFQMEQTRAGKMLTTLNNPAVREAFGQDVPVFQGKNIKSMFPVKYGAPSAVTRFNSVATTQFHSAVIQVIAGLKDLNTALRDAEEAANTTIQATLFK